MIGSTTMTLRPELSRIWDLPDEGSGQVKETFRDRDRCTTKPASCRRRIAVVEADSQTPSVRIIVEPENGCRFIGQRSHSADRLSRRNPGSTRRAWRWNDRVGFGTWSKANRPSSVRRRRTQLSAWPSPTSKSWASRPEAIPAAARLPGGFSKGRWRLTKWLSCQNAMQH